MSAGPVTAVSSANAQSVLQQANSAQRAGAVDQSVGKPAGYGLPCTKCRTYYAADLNTCPVCGSSERIAVVVSTTPSPIAPMEQLPDPALLEQERERFLREFKIQLTTFQRSERSTRLHCCIKEENHQNGPVTAAICLECYDHLQERVDVLEAVLRMDLKEAARIVYDAVWADPSDPTKTYENAANALLTELRKRSGVPYTFALLQAPLSD